jgi:hypothetical protein
MESRIPMRKTKVFAVATAALILAGIGGWASSAVNAGRTAAATPINIQMDPFQEMVRAKGLPASHYDDYSLIFN